MNLSNGLGIQKVTSNDSTDHAEVIFVDYLRQQLRVTASTEGNA